MYDNERFIGALNRFEFYTSYLFVFFKHIINFFIFFILFTFSYSREAVLAEMGVALKEDGGTIGVFSPKKVSVVAPGRL